MNALPRFSRQRGFGAVMAIVVLVILAALAAALTRFGTVQHLTAAQDVLAVRALAAARSGIEEGLYRALINDQCPPDSSTSWQRDLTADTGFHVSITCAASPLFHEGENTPGVPKALTVYTITATACNMPTGSGCPNKDAVTSPGYVERQLQTVATNVDPD